MSVAKEYFDIEDVRRQLAVCRRRLRVANVVALDVLFREMDEKLIAEMRVRAAAIESEPMKKKLGRRPGSKDWPTELRERARRMKATMTQKEIADALQIPRSTINAWTIGISPRGRRP